MNADRTMRPWRPLYTNPSQEGITQANTRPPWAKTFCQWKNRLWYANTRREHYLDIQLVDLAGLTTSTSTITLTVGGVTAVYTCSTSESARTKNFLKDSTSSTDAAKIRETMKSLVRVINQASDYFYAWYTSGIEEAPGIVTIERRTLSSTEFSVTCNSAATGASFEPTIPTTGTSLAFDEFVLLNGVYWSKEDDIETVWLLSLVGTIASIFVFVFGLIMIGRRPPSIRPMPFPYEPTNREKR